MAMHLRRNLIRGLARPAFHHHAGVPNPIGGGMVAARQFADGSCFSLILRSPCFDLFGHHSAPSSQKHSTSYCSPFEELSTIRMPWRSSKPLESFLSRSN